ncbi:MAG: class I SAM-dependent methyltransferase [Lentisphaerae bacterium]|nr:class I SAM-dependent methyltransferase [Lentisphaerota bacterium]
MTTEPPSVLYNELAPWWPLLSPREDYEEEAAIYARALKAAATPEPITVLELGSGVGNNASYLSSDFELTLVDRSPAMLAVSRALNPACEHIEGDMRTLDIGRLFDAVFIHDAIIYMTTEEELRATLATAARHCRPDGALLVIPDHVRERFVTTSGHGGTDGADGRGARYLQWSWDADPTDTRYETAFTVMLRQADGRVESHHERHTCGLFPRNTWLDLITEAGFEVDALPFEHSEIEDGVCEMFVGTRAKPASLLRH